MKANRRGFLGLLGVGAVSAPLAAKAAAEAEISKLTLLKSGGNLALGAEMSKNTFPPQYMGQVEEYVSPYVKASNYLNVWGKPPKFVDENVWERAKAVYCLDHDIASKRSWSLAAKIHEQRQRNYQREVDKFKHTGKYELAQGAFRKVTGFEWPW